MGSETEAKVIDPVDDGLHSLEDRLQGRALQSISTCLVKPAAATPSEKEWLPLSHLDYLWMAFYTPLICSYTLTDQVHRFGSAAGVVQRLRESLAEALNLFYPLAGRLLTKDGPPRIHCNDAGVVFTEASVDMDLVELQWDDFLPLPALSGFAAAGFDHYPALPETPDGLPALILQVTHFNCGGITIAANWSHGVADGQSGLHFMNSWSEIARGAPVSLLPNHQRELLMPRNPLLPGTLVKPAAVSPGAQAVAERIRPEKKDQEPEAEGGRKKPQIATRATGFTKDEMEAIRSAGADAGLTRVDCLATHIWRTVARARNLTGDARVRLWILVEGRARLAFPPGYFGNVVAMASVVTTAGELLQGPLRDTAAMVHAGVASVTAAWFRGFVDLVAASGGKDLFAPEPLGPDSDCGISSLVRFPYYLLDFGFGAPAFAARNTMGAWDGLVFVLPSPRGPGHAIVMPNLQPPALSKFIAVAHDLPATAL